MKAVFIMLVCLVSMASAQKTLKVTLERVETLNEITMPRELTDRSWPVLYLELDIGKVCLYPPPNNVEIAIEPVNYPQCPQLFCVGPRGPIVVWSRGNVLEHLAKCIITAMTKEGIIPNGDDITAYLPNRVIAIDKFIGHPTNVEFALSEMPPNTLRKVLTSADLMMKLNIKSKEKFHDFLIVKADSFSEGELCLCFFDEDIKMEGLTPQHLNYLEVVQCKAMCRVFDNKDFFNLEGTELVELFWTCLGNFIMGELRNVQVPLRFDLNDFGKIRILIGDEPAKVDDFGIFSKLFMFVEKANASGIRDEF